MAEGVEERRTATVAPGTTLKLGVLLTGQLVSWTGNTMNQVALPLLVIDRFGVGLSLGVVLAARLFPRLLLGPVVGILADRLPLRALIAVSTLVTAGLVGLIPFTTSLVHLYVIGVALGAIETVSRPAQFAFLPEVFPPEQLYKVNTAQEILDAISSLAGPVLAVGLVSAFGLTAAFLVDAATFVFYAITLLALAPMPDALRGGGTEDGHAAEVGGIGAAAVWRVLQAQPLLFALLAVNTVYTLGIGSLRVLFAPLALRSFEAGQWGYGVLASAAGVGALLGVALTPRIGPRLSARMLLGLLGASGLMLVASAFSPYLWLSAILLCLALTPESMSYLVFATESQRRVRRGMRGRYFGLALTVVVTALPVGNLLGGFFVAGLDPRAGVAIMGLGWSAVAAGGWILSRRQTGAE